MTEMELAFESPPVRAVELSLFFEAVPLKLTDLAPLVTALRADFPEATERFARMPWVYENSPEAQPGFVEEGAGSFPFPWLTFSNNEGHSVSFQDDRFMLRWEFGDDRKYPGYTTLAPQLHAQFQNFVTHAEEHLAQRVEVVRARAEYENEMPEHAAWSVAQQAYQLKTSSSPTKIDGLGSTSSGGLFHFEVNDLVTHVEYAAISEAESNTLSLRSTTRIAESTVSSAVDTLDEAHRNLIACFGKLTSLEQHESWGKR